MGQAYRLRPDKSKAKFESKYARHAYRLRLSPYLKPHNPQYGNKVVRGFCELVGNEKL